MIDCYCFPPHNYTCHNCWGSDMSEWCEQKDWVPDKKRKYRCSACNRRLTPTEVYDIFGTGLVGYKLPPHKKKGYKVRKAKIRAQKFRRNK